MDAAAVRRPVIPHRDVVKLNGCAVDSDAAAVASPGQVAAGDRQVKQLQRDAGEDFENAINMTSIDGGCVRGLPLDDQVVGNVKVACRRTVFVSSFERQVEDATAEHDRV